jgi:hypothetical protein
MPIKTFVYRTRIIAFLFYPFPRSIAIVRTGSTLLAYMRKSDRLLKHAGIVTWANPVSALPFLPAHWKLSELNMPVLIPLPSANGTASLLQSHLPGQLLGDHT